MRIEGLIFGLFMLTLTSCSKDDFKDQIVLISPTLGELRSEVYVPGDSLYLTIEYQGFSEILFLKVKAEGYNEFQEGYLQRNSLISETIFPFPNNTPVSMSWVVPDDWNDSEGFPTIDKELQVQVVLPDRVLDYSYPLLSE
ncbi:MAG: hypothetical protein ABJG41_03430 [Cyclobacteriaceae bacterium]